MKNIKIDCVKQNSVSKQGCEVQPIVVSYNNDAGECISVDSFISGNAIRSVWYGMAKLAEILNSDDDLLPR